MNDQKTDATENSNKEVTPARPDQQQEASKPAQASAKAFFKEEEAASVLTVTTLDTPIEAPAELDIDLIDVPVLTQVVEPDDKDSEVPQESE